MIVIITWSSPTQLWMNKQQMSWKGVPHMSRRIKKQIQHCWGCEWLTDGQCHFFGQIKSPPMPEICKCQRIQTQAESSSSSFIMIIIVSIIIITAVIIVALRSVYLYLLMVWFNSKPKIVWLLFCCLLVGSSHLLLVLFFFVCSVVGCSVGGLVLKVGLNSREKPWEATLTHFLPRWILVSRSWTHLTCFRSRNCI